MNTIFPTDLIQRARHILSLGDRNHTYFYWSIGVLDASFSMYACRQYEGERLEMYLRGYREREKEMKENHS
jgi:hypothetical protein